MTKNYLPKYLEEPFDVNFKFTDSQNIEYAFYIFELGLLNVVEGKLVACDPLIYDDHPPFSTDFPAGRFPVQLAVAKINDDERVSLARIKFSEALPVRWEMACCDSQNLTDLQPDEIFGYGVDTGTGSFMDTFAAKAYKQYFDADDNWEIISDELEENYRDTWVSLMWTAANNSNVAMFSTGWGDGFYASYIGYDASDTICRLVTDFNVVDEA